MGGGSRGKRSVVAIALVAIVLQSLQFRQRVPSMAIHQMFFCRDLNVGFPRLRGAIVGYCLMAHSWVFLSRLTFPI
jgi:hypothetical protein